MASRKPFDGSVGVVEDLNFCSRPDSSITKQSVNVPPTSTQTRFVFPDIGSPQFHSCCGRWRMLTPQRGTHLIRWKHECKQCIHFFGQRSWLALTVKILAISPVCSPPIRAHVN